MPSSKNIEKKFRAWDDNKKSFAYAVLRNSQILWVDSNFTDQKQYEGMVAFFFLQDWQQKIGLKDKNGKDIYEGDIVSFPDMVREVVTDDMRGPKYDIMSEGEIIFKNGSFGIKPDNATTGDIFTHDFYTFSDMEDEGVGLDDIEVVNNIYELWITT